jgi:hypothetical protein
MGTMAEGWLPPTAPGANPPPRFEEPAERPAFAPPQHAQPHQHQQQQQPAAATGPTFVRAPRPAPGEQNRAAVWAIALGITGLSLLLLSLGTLFLLTIPLSFAAVVLARRARAQIESGQTSQGANQASAALWLGRIGLIAGVAALVVFAVMIALGVDFEQIRDDLQRELDQQRERQDRDGDGGGGIRTAVEQLRAAAGAWLAR